MGAQDRKFFQQGVNMYVKAMSYSSDMLDLEPQSFSLGTPAAANPTKYGTLIAANSAANTSVAISPVGVADSPYGRNIVVTPSGVPGNANVVDVYGQDYLGQPMVERFTGSAAASAGLVGKKAFYRVLSVKNITPSTNAITVSVGTDVKLGFPYKGIIAFAREAGATILAAAITGTNQVLADLTDPATNVTGDPRGTYQAAASLNGVTKIEIELFGDGRVNAAGNGGLLGIQHFGG